MSAFDSRTTPARADLAAESLRGKVAAKRYTSGRVMAVSKSALFLHHAADPASIVDNELLFGERFTVYDEKGGWAWGQAERDEYVGYVRAEALSEPAGAPTHRVVSLASHLYAIDDFKTPAIMGLNFGTRLKVLGEGPRYFAVETSAGPGFVPAKHLKPLGKWSQDFVAVAERFLGVPYLWGGRTVAGIDCSALVQVALADTGQDVPRDSDQQQALGRDLGRQAVENLRRGDLVFWAGHVAIATDASHIIHANATAMAVSIDNVEEAVSRIEANDGPVIQISRL